MTGKMIFMWAILSHFTYMLGGLTAAARVRSVIVS
jgi:hypothetical protein